VNRTCNLPVCSAVPHPSSLPRTPLLHDASSNYLHDIQHDSETHLVFLCRWYRCLSVCLSVCEGNLLLVIYLHQIRNWYLFSLLLLLFIFLCVSIAQNRFPPTSSLVVARRPYIVIRTKNSIASSLSGSHFKLNGNGYLAFTRLVIMIRHGSK
jgi:hypothetical protein